MNNLIYPSKAPRRLSAASSAQDTIQPNSFVGRGRDQFTSQSNSEIQRGKYYKHWKSSGSILGNIFASFTILYF